jgi:hypothetical protein
MSRMKYVPIQQQWRKLGPLYRSFNAAAIWFPEMEAFSFSRAEDRGYPYRPAKLTPDLLPSHYDSCDWRFCRDRPGPAPSFWDYACHGACHWTCSLHLWVAMQVQPDRPWRIVTTNKHSTVWDGEHTLWDGNFLALGIPADEAWELAASQPDTEFLPVGKPMLHEPPNDAIESLERVHA